MPIINIFFHFLLIFKKVILRIIDFYLILICIVISLSTSNYKLKQKLIKQEIYLWMGKFNKVLAVLENKNNTINMIMTNGI